MIDATFADFARDADYGNDRHQRWRADIGGYRLALWTDDGGETWMGRADCGRWPYPVETPVDLTHDDVVPCLMRGIANREARS